LELGDAFEWTAEAGVSPESRLKSSGIEPITTIGTSEGDCMHRRLVELALLLVCAGQAGRAQEFKLWDRTVQVHGFVSQGFIHTDNNNWLTMNTSHVGSGEFTDFGANVSMQISDQFRVGAQIYDRHLGNLGEWHPSLDWAFADYRFKPWLGIRGGKVKTVIGLYNDTQDLEFLHTFALLPQSVYPTDLRDATISHVGGDVYGMFTLKHHCGDLAYTAYVGHRHDSDYSGYACLLVKYGITGSDYGGLQYGGDLPWTTPLKGLLLGASRMNEELTDRGSVALGPVVMPFSAVSKADWTNQYYGEYSVGKLRIDSEYRRFVHHQIVNEGMFESISDVRGWYVSGAYRILKHLELGSYYSRYTITSVAGGPLAAAAGPLFPQQTDTSLPANHIYDKVITARIDLNRFWNVKVEGHLMDEYGLSSYPAGFYPQVNPDGFNRKTNALVLRTSMNF
jgi:hypothetical protein